MNASTLDRRHELLFGVRRSIRYHARREMFFERLHSLIRFCTVVSGSGVIARATAAHPEDAILIAFAAATALFSAIDLVIGTDACARRHLSLRQRFGELERRLALAGEAPEPAALAEFEADRISIEMAEPPVLRVLDCLCHNELARAMGYTADQFVKIAWYQRLLAHFVDVQGGRLRVG